MSSIKLKTRIPGPKSLVLLNKKKQVVSDGILSPKIFIQKAQGALVTDVDGNTLIDFTGGIGATNSGHGNKEIITAIKKQADRFLHSCFGVTGYEPYLDLCEKLNKITPGKFQKKTALFNSGAEAVENAVKIARKFTGRKAIVSFEHAFHGRTLLTLSLTSKVKPYKFGFGPFIGEAYKLDYPYVYRRPTNCETEDAYVDHLINHIKEEFFLGVVAPEEIAAFIIEPVTGEGGFIVPPKRYMQELAKLCRQHGILLIVDEVQSGFCRTGKMFASEYFFEVEYSELGPDIITMAKSLSNGMPLSAVTGRKEIMDSVQENGLGGTFCGNPVSCEAALASINFMEKNKLAKRAEKIGKIVLERFHQIQKHSKIVGDVRGLGAMCAIEIVKERKTKEPDHETTDKIIKRCYENGLMVLGAGILGNDIRTLMPLTITDVQLEEALNVISKVVMEFS